MVRRKIVLSREFVDRVLRDVTDLLASRRSRGEAMFRGGSFDRSGAGLELHEECKSRREVELSNTDQIRAASGIRTHQPSILKSNLVPTRVWGQAALAKRRQQRLPQWY